MTKDEVCSRIREIAIIPAIRAASGPDAHFAAEAVTRGGISIVEITMTITGAVELMAHLVRSNPKLIVGAGTVLDTDTARLCVDAGVSFVTAPSLDPAILEFAAKENIVVVPGALTPTELIPTEAIQRRQSQRIHELARRFARLVKDAREQIAAWKKTQVVKQYTGTEKCEK